MIEQCKDTSVDMVLCELDSQNLDNDGFAGYICGLRLSNLWYPIVLIFPKIGS